MSNNLKLQKRLATSVKKCGKRKIWLDPNESLEISNANSRASIRKLIKDGYIIVKPVVVHSRARARKRHLANFRGNHSGFGKRKGTRNARNNTKEIWSQKVRVLRRLLKKYRQNKKIDRHFHSVLYMKVKGNCFKNKRVLVEYIHKKSNERNRLKLLKDQSDMHRLRKQKARQRRAERIVARRQQITEEKE